MNILFCCHCFGASLGQILTSLLLTNFLKHHSVFSCNLPLFSLLGRNCPIVDIEDSQIIFTQIHLSLTCIISVNFKFRKDDEYQF